MAEYFIKRDYYTQPDTKKSLREIGDEAAHLYQSYLDTYNRAENDTTDIRGAASNVGQLGRERDALSAELATKRLPSLHVRKQHELKQLQSKIDWKSTAVSKTTASVSRYAIRLAEIAQESAEHYATYAEEYHEIALMDAHSDSVGIVVTEPLVIGTTEADTTDVYARPIPHTGSSSVFYGD